MARVIMVQGLPTVLCPACNVLHQIDTRFLFNYDKERPTFKPDVKLTVGPFPPGHKWEGKKVECNFKIELGSIRYLTTSTHELAGEIVGLPDFDEIAAAARARKEAAAKPRVD